MKFPESEIAKITQDRYVKVVVRVLARPQAPNRGVYSYGLMWARAAGI